MSIVSSWKSISKSALLQKFREKSDLAQDAKDYTASRLFQDTFQMSQRCEADDAGALVEQLKASKRSALMPKLGRYLGAALTIGGLIGVAVCPFIGGPLGWAIGAGSLGSFAVGLDVAKTSNRNEYNTITHNRRADTAVAQIQSAARELSLGLA